MNRVVIKKTPMGAYHWVVQNSQTGVTLATSCDYETRAEVLDAAMNFEGLFADAPVVDLTPEGRKEARNG